MSYQTFGITKLHELEPGLWQFNVSIHTGRFGAFYSLRWLYHVETNQIRPPSCKLKGGGHVYYAQVTAHMRADIKRKVVTKIERLRERSKQDQSAIDSVVRTTVEGVRGHYVP